MRIARASNEITVEAGRNLLKIAGGRATIIGLKAGPEISGLSKQFGKVQFAMKDDAAAPMSAGTAGPQLENPGTPMRLGMAMQPVLVDEAISRGHDKQVKAGHPGRVRHRRRVH